MSQRVIAAEVERQAEDISTEVLRANVDLLSKGTFIPVSNDVTLLLNTQTTRSWLK